MVNIQTCTASQIQLDSDFYLIIRENVLWRIHWFILVETSPNMYCQLDSEIFWLLLWVSLQNMWWTAHLFTIFLIDSFGVFMKICGEHIHCRIKQVQTCTANLNQKFFWLLLTYLESVCSCIWSSSPGKFTVDHQANNHQITVDLRLRIMQVPLTQMLSYCISVNSCRENY